MLLLAFIINTLLVCSITSLAQCASGGNVPYISDVIQLCKQSGHAYVVWMCFLAFAALVCVQIVWMERVARAWFDEQVFHGKLSGLGTSAPAEPGSRGLFLALCVAAVVGFGFVVGFDSRDTSEFDIVMHRVGVVLLAFGGFGALQVVWVTLRAGDSAMQLRGEVGGNEERADVPWLSWVEVDVLFLVVLGVFMVTALTDGHHVVSAVFEYIAFAVLLTQTSWLFVLCWERDAWTRGARGAGATGLLWALLGVYTAEVLVILLVVL